MRNIVVKLLEDIKAKTVPPSKAFIRVSVKGLSRRKACFDSLSKIICQDAAPPHRATKRQNHRLSGVLASL